MLIEQWLENEETLLSYLGDHWFSYLQSRNCYALSDARERVSRGETITIKSAVNDTIILRILRVLCKQRALNVLEGSSDSSALLQLSSHGIEEIKKKTFEKIIDTNNDILKDPQITTIQDAYPNVISLLETIVVKDEVPPLLDASGGE